MKIEVNLNKKSFLFLSILIVFVVGGIFVYAYNINFDKPVSAAVNFGHSADEVIVRMSDGSLRSVQDLLEDYDSTGQGSISKGYLVFDSPGSYSVYAPSGATKAKFQVIGGGGGGGPTYLHMNQISGGSGGGSGAYAEKTIDVSAGLIGTVIVGAAGNISNTLSNCYIGSSYSKNLARSTSGGESSFTDKNNQKIIRAGGGGGGDAYPWPWAGTYPESIGTGGVALVGSILVNGADGGVGGSSTSGVGGVNSKAVEMGLINFGRGGDGGVSLSDCELSGGSGVIVVTFY